MDAHEQGGNLSHLRAFSPRDFSVLGERGSVDGRCFPSPVALHLFPREFRQAG
jgi:hypothetical protein